MVASSAGCLSAWLAPPCLQGNPEAPRCGFSRKVVDALRSCGAQFGSFDILGDEAVRQGLKVRTDAPALLGTLCSPQNPFVCLLIPALWPLWSSM